MSKTRSALVEITGRVFVDEIDLLDKLKETYPDRILPDFDEIDIFTVAEIRTAFQDIAKEKISEKFPTDTPFKYNEVIIDMNTFNI